MKDKASGPRESHQAESQNRPIDPWAATPHIRHKLKPEDVFLAWLLKLPSGADVALSARKAIGVLEEAGSLSPQAMELCGMLREAAYHTGGVTSFVGCKKGGGRKRGLVH